MGWLFDVLGISVDGFVSSIFNGIINWIYEVIFSVIKVVFTKINETGSDLFRLPWVQSLVNFFYILGWALFAIGLVVSISGYRIQQRQRRCKDNCYKLVKSGFGSKSIYYIAGTFI